MEDLSENALYYEENAGTIEGLTELYIDVNKNADIAERKAEGWRKVKRGINIGLIGIGAVASALGGPITSTAFNCVMGATLRQNHSIRTRTAGRKSILYGREYNIERSRNHDDIRYDVWSRKRSKELLNS